MGVPEGVGIGLRMEFARELLARTDRTVDWIEVTPENFLRFGGKRRRLLEACAERWTLVPHSVSLSIGGPDPLDEALIAEMGVLCKAIGAPYWSDHICYSSLFGTFLHDLLPLPFTAEAVAYVAGRIRQLQARCEVPLVFENPTFYAHMPGSTMDEAPFLGQVLAASGSEMLLDLNNVYVNSRNHGGDPRAFIDRMLEHPIRQLHLAGHRFDRCRNTVLDTHEGPIVDEVWELFSYTVERAGRLIPTLIEWDQSIPSLDAVLDEADRARSYARQVLEVAA